VTFQITSGAFLDHSSVVDFYLLPISSGDSTCFVIGVVRGPHFMVDPSVGRLHTCSLDLEKPGILISLPRFFEIIFLLVNGQLIWKTV
jgi:hypothetical protein